MNSKFFRLFTIDMPGRKKEIMTIILTANLFNVILLKKDQLHILTFEAETKRFKMLIINVGKKVHKNVGISKNPTYNVSLQ